MTTHFGLILAAAVVVPGLFPRVPLKATGKGVGNLVRADLCLDFVKRTKFPKPFGGKIT